MSKDVQYPAEVQEYYNLFKIQKEDAERSLAQLKTMTGDAHAKVWCPDFPNRTY